MIKNITPLTFEPFGKIINNSFDENCYNILGNNHICKTCSISKKSSDFLYKNSSNNTLIDIIDGIALLCIATNDNPDSIQTFLLDKPIILNKNVYYEILTLYDICKVKVATDKENDKETIKVHNKIIPYSIYSKVEINNIHTLFYQEKELDFKFKGEKHDFWELTYVDKGQLFTKVNNKSYSLKQGQVIFYAPNQYHNQKGISKIPTCFMTITFDMNFDNASFFINKVFNVNTDLKNTLEKILIEKKNQHYYSDDLILCYLKEFIIKLIRSVKLENTLNHLDTQVQDNIENSIVSKSIIYIHNNINKKLTIPDIAANIPISPSYLSKIFKKHMKMTTVDYINQYRLEKSKEYIRNSNYNFTQISYILGYNSVHYFSKQFKKYYGVSPSTFSKSIKQ